MSTAAIADTATTPASLLARLTDARDRADDAEREVLTLAVAWAHAHPAIPGDDSWVIPTLAGWHPSEYDATVADSTDFDDEVAWAGIPPVAWDAPAAFAAANDTSTTAGKALLRDALVLHHRLPHTWARLTAGHIPAWRARRIAQAVLGAPNDVTTAIDLVVAPIAGTIGPITLARRIDEAMQRLHAEERELQQDAALARRYADLEDLGADTTGLATFTVRGDYKDLHDFNTTVTAVAAALRAHGCTEPLDVRRALAIGILADPDQAAALLTGTDVPAPTKQTVLHLHLTDLAIMGLDTVGHDEKTRRAFLAQQIRSWCARTDTHLVVKPVIDLSDTGSIDAYAIPHAMRERTTIRLPECVFPWCTRPARRCDLDHITPHARGGATADHNLAPLCRHHHLLKTHAGWTYRPLDPHPVLPPSTYIWTDPHGIDYVRGPTGTQRIRTITLAA